VFTTLPTWEEQYKKIHQANEKTRRDVRNNSAENLVIKKVLIQQEETTTQGLTA